MAAKLGRRIEAVGTSIRRLIGHLRGRDAVESRQRSRMDLSNRLDRHIVAQYLIEVVQKGTDEGTWARLHPDWWKRLKEIAPKRSNEARD